jgi:hypothetical protein
VLQVTAIGLGLRQARIPRAGGRCVRQGSAAKQVAAAGSAEVPTSAAGRTEEGHVGNPQPCVPTNVILRVPSLDTSGLQRCLIGHANQARVERLPDRAAP